MAGGNQGQGRRNDGPDRNANANGGAGQQQGREPQSTGQKLQEGMHQVSDRFREGYDTAREEMAHRYRQAEGKIARHPGNSLLLGFGLGFGIGLALTAMLMHRDEETWADRYLPDSLRDLPDTLRNARVPESVRSAVRDAHVPDSLHHTFHHLAEAIRDIPSTISRAVGR
jgi:hypothetical protein